jgi:hypothetical protein
MSNQLPIKVSMLSKATTPANTTFQVSLGLQNGWVIVDNNPFGNCQLFSLGYFNQLLIKLRPSNYKHVNKVLKEIKTLCRINKRLCQVDLPASYLTELKPHINIHTSKTYRNLTTSNMVSMIIRVD